MHLSQNTLWRIVQPVLLGTVANVLVNVIFDPAQPDLLWSEFLAAVLLAIPITELNRLIDIRLEKRYNWITSFVRRFVYHLVLLLLCTLLVLNVVGNLYILIRGDGFYAWHELITINMVAFAVSLVLTLFTWMAFYYKRWKLTERSLHQSKDQLDEIRSRMEQVSQPITLYKGKKQFKIRAEEVRQAKSQSGVVRVWLQTGGSGIFGGTLAELLDLLPDQFFFPAGRNMIIHRDTIQSVASSSYGKIAIEIDPYEGHQNSLTISRQKASAFRKWYSGTSV